jgi:hypothetical protein
MGGIELMDRRILNLGGVRWRRKPPNAPEGYSDDTNPRIDARGHAG